MYLVLALLAALENLIPPIPTDLVVALGAFLSHQGVTRPVTVFLVVWTANIAGAVGVYYAARRYGRRLFASRAGRWLLSPGALASIERGYFRFGVIGIFIGRVLPGIRAVVAPFAGIANLSPARALIPMAVASGLWYAGITAVGTVIGAEWSRIEALVQRINHVFGVVGSVALVAIAVWLVVRWRRRLRERVWAAAERALGPEITAGHAVDPRDAGLLVLELAYADEVLTPEDRVVIETHLRSRWGLEPAGRRATNSVEAEPKRLARYRDRIVARFGREQRLAVVEGMWHAVFADVGLGDHEERLMTRAADLLGIDRVELAEVRRRLRGAP